MLIRDRLRCLFTGRPERRDAYVLWFTGISGAGKSTIADIVYDRLTRTGRRVERLDGDSVRAIFPGIGFTREERNRHITQIGFLASMLEKNGVIVVASFVSPYAQSRDFVRGMCRQFIEVFVDTPLALCEKRDVKGLYAKARRGEIKHFTAIDDPFEAPLHPELVLNTRGESVDESVEAVLRYLEQRGC